MKTNRPEEYSYRARKALKDKVLQAALADFQNRLGKGTARAYRELPEGLGVRLLEAMLFQRALDQRMLNLQRQGRIGFYGTARITQRFVVAILRNTDDRTQSQCPAGRT